MADRKENRNPENSKPKIRAADDSVKLASSVRKRQQAAFWSIIAVTLLILLSTCIYLIFFQKKPVSQENPNAVQMYNPKTAMKNLSVRVPENLSYPEGIQEKYKALYAADNRFVGWLTIPNTCIDTAVYQPDNGDNNYFIKKDLWGRYSRYGTVFMDAYDDAADMRRNTVLYGHNFDDDGDGGYEDIIFGAIHNYLDVDFYRKNPIIEYDTIYKDYKWKVFACFLTNGSSTDDNGYLFYYIATGMNDENFMDFVEEVRERSHIQTSVDIQPTDKILTLSTCTYFFDRGGSLQNARCVLMARMVRDGESEEVDVASATQNENPRYPQLYYNVFGGSNPYADAERWYPEE